MPWGTEFPTRVRTHRTAWSTELAALPGPPHREVWSSPGAQANAPALTATAELLTPTAKSGVVAKLPASGDSFPHQFPWQFSGPGATLSAKAELLTPSVGVGPAPVAAPVLAASAELLAPTVSVTTEDVIVEAPLLTASADMPAADLVAVVEAPLLTASAARNGFPYRFPRSFAPNGFLVPDLVAGASLPTAEASADLLAPTVAVHYSAAAPTATATAEVPTPNVSSGVAATVPVAVASAELLTPSVIWDQPPVITPYTASTTVDVSALRAAGYTDLVLVGIGGGEAGTNGSFITGTGGKAGAWNSLNINLAAYPDLTTLTITVGNGGASNGADGAATTISGNGGMPTLTCAGGSGGSGAWNGQAAGNTTVDGDPYTGGSGGTGSSGSPGGEPGGGGAGGPVFSAGAAGGKGRAWVKAKRVN